ncbi:MAG TPA: hypothetical protein VKF41_00370 [Bryobacteraceae bacterium]|nr:hypothetical protein [Bryobacteraceae bacterium]
MPEQPPLPVDLIRRLPATFGPALRDQFAQWNLLFSAERRQLQAQLDWLSRLPREEFDRLFAPLAAIESRMALPGWNSNAATLGVRDTGILARSPAYPQWRAEVERVFTRIDEATAPSAGLQGLRRLVVCVLPSGIPLQDQPLWPDLAREGAWLPLERPFGGMLPSFGAAIATRTAAPELDRDERTWVIECDSRFSALPGVPVLSWAELDALRREFLRRLNAVQRDLRSVDQTGEELRRADIGRLTPPAVAANARVREFLRGVLLSGNGSLVFPNSFVEWGASEALRRAQPQALIACFGIREKLKPFSSLVLFEDQNRANPVADQEDATGSLVDALLLSRYVYLAAQRVACYPGHTLTLLAACDSNRVLALGAPGADLPHAPAAAEDLAGLALRWLD